VNGVDRATAPPRNERVRLSRTTPTLHSFGGALRRAGSVLREALLLATPLAALEAAGPYSPHDGTDLLVLTGVAAVVYLLVRAARRGWLPGASALGGALRTLGLRLFRAVSPRYAMAFRPTAEVAALPDQTLLAPIAVLTGLLVAAATLGHLLFPALLALKQGVSYTLYLGALATLWALLFVAVVFGSIATAQWLQSLGRRGSLGVAPLVFAFGWVGALMLVLALPASTPLAVVLVLGALRAHRLGGAPTQSYLFCRRDEKDRARTIPVHVYLQRAHAGIVLLLGLIVALAGAQRLWMNSAPRAPFTFTTWLGVLATLCSIILLVRAGIHFQRVLGGGTPPPETPLTPTLWIQDPERHGEPWQRVARESGWLALLGAQTPAHEFDLVLGDATGPRRFAPRPPLSDEDARFLLERRFHIVMRRRFHRRFQSLYKRLRAEQPAQGSGFLFCPHVWLVPGVVRDVEPKARGGSGSLTGPVLYGPSYAEAFPHRIRRYIGGVLRDLEIDIIYWEDAVGWPDIRRVLGVAFEIHDQRRGPLQGRHFIGLPRVRVVVQEEEADPDPTGDPLRPRKPTLEKKAPGHARILLIVRDRGDYEDLDVPDPVDSWIKSPSLV
jgi:hypothetical protein